MIHLSIEVQMLQKYKEIAEEKEVNFYYPDENTVTISINETTTLNDINEILDVLQQAAEKRNNCYLIKLLR